MKEFDVIVLTDKRYLKDSETDNYKHNVFFEDFLVLEALRLEDLRVHRLSWDDATFDWSSTKAILFRTTWDYFTRFDEFSDWLSKVTPLTMLMNSETIIRWNIDKHYLIDLKNKGVHIAKTIFIEKGSTETLMNLHKQLGCSEVVLKPSISGGSRHTYKINRDTIESHELIFKELISKEALLLQPFQNNIISLGEISIMVFNGRFTHAILKKAKPGDFRVQEAFGGNVQDYCPTDEEINFAEYAVKACPEMPIYARVDLFTDNENTLALLELELIEPELWFRHVPKAAHVLAKAIKSKLS